MARKKSPRSLKEYADDRERFDRQPYESAQAFEAFMAYARIPYQRKGADGRRGSRSLSVAAEEVGKSLGRMKELSSLWRWVERAEAYDQAQIEDELRAIAVAKQEAQLRIARRRIEIQDDAHEMYTLAKAKFVEGMAFPLFTSEDEILEDGPNSPSLVVHRYPLENVTLSQIASVGRVAVALGLVAMDDGTKPLDTVLSAIDPKNLTDEQLQALTNDADPLRALFSGPSSEEEGRGGDRATASAG